MTFCDCKRADCLAEDDTTISPLTEPTNPTEGPVKPTEVEQKVCKGEVYTHETYGTSSLKQVRGAWAIGLFYRPISPVLNFLVFKRFSG